MLTIHTPILKKQTKTKQKKNHTPHCANVDGMFS